MSMSNFFFFFSRVTQIVFKHLFPSSSRTCNGHAELCSRSYGNVTFIGAHDSFAASLDPALREYTTGSRSAFFADASLRSRAGPGRRHLYPNEAGRSPSSGTISHVRRCPIHPSVSLVYHQTGGLGSCISVIQVCVRSHTLKMLILTFTHR